MEGVVLTGLGVAFVFYASFGRSGGGGGGRVGTFYFGVDLDWVGGFSLVVHRQLFHDLLPPGCSVLALCSQNVGGLCCVGRGLSRGS